MALKKIKSDSVCHTKFIKIDKQTMQDNDENIYEYWTVNTSSGVLVVPIRIVNNKVSFILTKQYRVAIEADSIEFPKGAIDYNEAPEAAARRELLEEVGYVPEHIKFFYKMNSIPPSNDTLLVYLAIIKDENPIKQKLDRLESAAGLKVMEVSADELLKMIKNNDIMDGQSLAALSAILLQTGAAAQYLETLGV